MKNLLALFIFMILSAAALAQEWQSLLEDSSFSKWTGRDSKPPGAGWQVKEGVLHRAAAAGDLVSKDEFLNFEFEFEWKISGKGNSGVKYRVSDYAPLGAHVGIEYQLLDDQGHSNGKVQKTSNGSLYDLLPPVSVKKLHPAGEWNSSRIVVQGNAIEHWLNGEKVVSVTVGSEPWKVALAQSKFRRAAEFGTKKGRLLLQDHGDEVWFRKLRVRALSEQPAP